MASSASRARLRIPRPTVSRSTATPAAAPAAITPMAAPAIPARRQPTVEAAVAIASPALISLTVPRSSWVVSVRSGPVRSEPVRSGPELPGPVRSSDHAQIVPGQKRFLGQDPADLPSAVPSR